MIYPKSRYKMPLSPLKQFFSYNTIFHKHGYRGSFVSKIFKKKENITKDF